MKKYYHYLKISQVNKLIREGRTSPVEIVDACLERIGELNAKLNAFITVLSDEARQQAKQAEEEIRKGNWRGAYMGFQSG